MRRLLLTCSVAGLAGCATVPPPVGSPTAVSVTAVGETEPVGTANADAADDPAIWRNAADPAASLIVATDKKAGLHVYDLDGRRRSFANVGRVNNVDLADLGAQGVIIAASDRNDIAHAKLQLFRLDTAAAQLVPLGAVDGGSGEGYGICLGTSGGDLRAYSVLKDGTVNEYRIDLGGVPRSVLLATHKLASQAEGCVVDPRDGTVYVGEEDVGVWRFGKGMTSPKLVAAVDNKHLVADTEGVALITEGTDSGMLVVSSQGDSSYALYRLPDMEPAGRFRIVAGRYGATSETDGIALMGGSFGPDYPTGLFVAQDGDNAPYAQNFKLVSWAEVQKAIAAER
ncbi:phytase [Novosphingobium sp. G106]|uniref:phytase n=1 Tax=Novosphingobium sp. G106 TaxID=2849500 RepID=UPI001C2D2AD4|nr:phytase [Novosphingobium sp. G106]MBV1686754.1 phytase [Novosphingobium sp. G106]